MTAQEWITKAAARADTAAWRLKGLQLTECGAEEKLHEAADELRTALNHCEDAVHLINRQHAPPRGQHDT